MRSDGAPSVWLNKRSRGLVWMAVATSCHKGPGMMRISTRFASLAMIAVVFTGCSASTATPPASTSATTPAGTTAPAAAPSLAGKTLKIAYGENAQFELTAPSGQRVVLDLDDPTVLTAPLKASDIVLITHLHTDHYNAAVVDAFTGTKLVNKNDTLTSGDLKVTSLAASHDDNPIVAADPTNHIFVIEFAGFKIVDLGSTGQLTLNADQLTAIGTNVDIAIGPLQNVGGADPSSKKQIDLFNQIKPKLIIPTHTSLDYIQAAAKQWDPTWSEKQTVVVPLDRLPTAKPTFLCLGSLATSYGTILSAPEWKW